MQNNTGEENIMAAEGSGRTTRTTTTTSRALHNCEKLWKFVLLEEERQFHIFAHFLNIHSSRRRGGPFPRAEEEEGFMELLLLAGSCRCYLMGTSLKLPLAHPPTSEQQEK